MSGLWCQRRPDTERPKRSPAIIGRVLRTRGLDVDAVEVDRIVGHNRYKAVVLVTSLYTGKQPESARTFATQSRATSEVP